MKRILLSQLGPMFGSGQLQAPLTQTALPGHWSLPVHATAPPQDLKIKSFIFKAGSHITRNMDKDVFFFEMQTNFT